MAQIGDRIIAVGDTMEETLEKVRRKSVDPRDVVVDYVPEEEVIFII